MYNQGMVVYQTILPKSLTYNFTVKVSDFAILYLDDKFIGTLDRSQNAEHSVTITCIPGNCKLWILV